MIPRVAAFGFVSGVCLVLNNAVLIVADDLGAGVITAVASSFALVVVVGYILHARLAFKTRINAAEFGRYLAAMSVNLPIALALILILHNGLGFVMWIAAPTTSVGTFIINFLLCKLAVFRKAEGIAP